MERMVRTIGMVCTQRLERLERAVGNHWSERYIRSIGLERLDGAVGHFRIQRLERAVWMVLSLRLVGMERSERN